MKYDFDLVLEEENSLSKIIGQIEEGTTVLEFGPATGRMTKYLKEHLKCKVYIVELDEESARKASKYAEDTIIGDIELYEWLERWEIIQFDYIIFADVLEHLRNPQEVLSKTKLILKDEGKTIFSVPNVGHNSILINLFNNIFNYTPVGLLDNTHIHLFAYNTLKVVCNNAGYIPIIEDAIYIDVGENEVSSFYNQVNRDVQRELKKRIYNNVYQFVFVLQKINFVKRNGIDVVRKIIPYTNDYKFQIYFDLGNGYIEENSSSITFNPEYKKTFKVSVMEPQKIEKIRIDPIDCAGIVGIKEIVLYKKSITEKLDLSRIQMTSNALYQKDNKFFFFTEDPNIYIGEVDWKDVEYIQISCDYFDIQEDMKSIFKEFIEKINDIQNENDVLQNDLKLANEELERRLIELEHRMNVINERDQEIQLLRNCN